MTEKQEKKTETVAEVAAFGKDRLRFFNEAEAFYDPAVEEPTPDTILFEPHEKKKKHAQAKLTNMFPKEDVLLDIPDERLICSECGGKLKPCNKKFLRREMQIVPKQEKLLTFYTVNYICESCKTKNGVVRVTTARSPLPLMEHSMATPATVAYIMAHRYIDGVSFARQEEIYEREGIALSRATMANWVIRCTRTWLRPLYRHMKRELLTHSVIHACGIDVQVLKDDGTPAATEARMRLYASAELLKHQVRLFEYQTDGGEKRPEQFLKGFKGALVTDGFAGYDQVADVTQCGCWASVKRKWEDAMPDGAAAKTSKAAIGIQYCDKLFSEERRCIVYKTKHRKEYRQNRERPILEEYYIWLNTVHPEKGSKLEEAVHYSINQKRELCAFLESGEIPVTNTLAKNAIESFAAEQNNLLFCNTLKDADACTVVYSLIESAKANELKPFEYLQHVLIVMPYLGKNLSYEELESLMPWADGVQKECKAPKSNAYSKFYLD